MQDQLSLTGGADRRAYGFNDDHLGYELREDEIIVDSFAGAGGMSYGIKWATGREPDAAINHWPEAINTHEFNHPSTKHYSASVYALDPREVAAGRKVGIFWASPDCFLAGTLVMTKQGLMPIEEIKVGDMVLTHKGRWRPVTKTWKQRSETVEVKGYGHYGLVTTPGHAFYSKHITTRYPNRKKPNGNRIGPVRTLVENPYWPEARDMKGKLWATPHSFPESSIPICAGAEFSIEFFYFLGRWLGDGTLNKGDVEICAGLHEAESLEKHFMEAPLCNSDGEELPFRTIDRGATQAFVWGNASLGRWLKKEAGHGSHEKKLPIWCLSMQRCWREAVLQGYLDADGHNDGRRTSASSVSKNLALGMKLLATTLGHSVSFMFSKGGPGTIEGREIVARDRYHISWTTDLQRETSRTDTIHRYTPVKSVEEHGEREVHCLQVDEDESFVADGIVVHNCRSHSRARGGAPKSKSVRDLAWVVVHWAKLVSPRAIGVENVAEFRDWCPLDDKGRAIKEKKGETFRQWVSELEALGYSVEWRILNAADYGAPTTRKRLFIQARRDGLPILWPAETHGSPDNLLVETGVIQPWRTAAECIDYAQRTNSIFLTKEEAKKYGCKRPLSEKTMKRVARGLFRQVINAKQPYIVEYGSGAEENDNPFAASGRRPGVVIPLTHQGDLRFHSPDAPMPTVTGANRGELAWVSPFFARTAHGEVDSKGRKRGRGDHGPLEPYPTVTSSQDSALVCPTLVQTGYGEREGQKPRSLDIGSPLGTVVAGGSKHALVAAMLHCNNQNAIGSTPAQPLKTVMAGSARHVYIDAELEGGVDRSQQVADFLWENRDLSEVEVTRDSVGTLMVGGVPLRITDIGLRMLSAMELASAQGFDDSFDPSTRVETDEEGNKKLVKNTATAMVKMIGNSVAPPVGAAVIGAMIGRGFDEKGRSGEEILDRMRRKAA